MIVMFLKKNNKKGKMMRQQVIISVYMILMCQSINIIASQTAASNSPSLVTSDAKVTATFAQLPSLSIPSELYQALSCAQKGGDISAKNLALSSLLIVEPNIDLLIIALKKKQAEQQLTATTNTLANQTACRYSTYLDKSYND